jgi:hypothetical protein
LCLVKVVIVPVRQTESENTTDWVAFLRTAPWLQTAESNGGRTCRTGRFGERQPLTEGTMGIAIFLILAFVMLGVDRLVTYYKRSHPVQHGATPGS